MCQNIVNRISFAAEATEWALLAMEQLHHLCVGLSWSCGVRTFAEIDEDTLETLAASAFEQLFVRITTGSRLIFLQVPYSGLNAHMLSEGDMGRQLSEVGMRGPRSEGHMDRLMSERALDQLKLMLLVLGQYDMDTDQLMLLLGECDMGRLMSERARYGS